ncbi:MAG: PAS domain S-box protein, partial [Alphaproteobacteria bacterium]|nr:PAS domain S-box protein [Alphaproteobacteria bacterium]
MKKKPQTVKKDTKRNDLDANQRFDHLFNIPLIGIGLYTVPDKRWIEVNDALCNLMGYSREEVMELTWIDLTHPDDIYDNARLFEDAVLGSGPKAYSLDKRFIRKDGSILHTTINVQSIREADGTPKYNVLFIQDVSEQKRAEQEILALKEKEQKQELSKYQQRLELALSSANFGTWVRQYDDDTVIWDSRTEAIFGFEPGAFEGTMDAVLDKIHPDDHEIVNAAYKQSVTSDTSYDIDYRIILTSGEIRHVASRAAVIKDEEGRPTQITGVLLDVTERKKTEEALRESEQLIQSFLQHTSSAITIKNQKGELLLCNPTYQQWLKAEGEDIKGKTLHEFLPPETAEAIARHDKKVFESGKPSSEERTNDFPDGVTRSLISHKFPIFHDDGDVHAIGTILTDLSERLRAEEAESANQTKSEFLASMSHEIRTPLNAILGFAQLMGTSESEPPTETQKVSLDQILSGGGHLLSLIDEILDLAKIESGDLSLVVEATDISSIIAECITSATQLGREEGLEIVNHTTGQTLPNVNIDTTRFRQVLLNLLSNAVKYNRPGGKVFVGFDHAGPDMVRIMVSDTGPGIL